MELDLIALKEMTTSSKSRAHVVIFIIFGFVAELVFRGLLEYRSELEGVFVVVLDGEAV